MGGWVGGWVGGCLFSPSFPPFLFHPPTLPPTHPPVQDELTKEIKEGRILEGFVTPPCLFPPTFKVLRGKGGGGGGGDIGYNPKRLPSYTDRILYKSLPSLTENLTLVHHQW